MTLTGHNQMLAYIQTINKADRLKRPLSQDNSSFLLFIF